MSNFRQVWALSLTSAVALWASSSMAPANTLSWTQYQGNAAHNGYVPVSIAASEIQQLWSVSNAELGQSSLLSGVVTDADHVYLTGKVSSSTWQVLALHRQTGGESWRQSFVPYGSSLSQPSVGNGMVYVHQWGHSGISGGNPAQYPYLMGINALSGDMEFATSHSGQWSSGSRPTVAGTQVFAAGGYYGGLDGYNGVTGDHSWFSNVNQQYGWIPAADDDRVYVYMGPASASPGPQVGTLYAFNRATGSTAFTIQNPADVHSLYNGTVFLGEQSDAITLTYNKTITSFDLKDHDVRWRKAGNYNGSFALADGILFAGNGVQLDLLEEATGNLLDKWFAPAGQSITGNLLVTDTHVFAQTAQTTYALNRNTLTPDWSVNVTGDLALGDGLLLISNSGAVTAFAIPEPTCAALLLSGSLILLRRHRR